VTDPAGVILMVAGSVVNVLIVGAGVRANIAAIDAACQSPAHRTEETVDMKQSTAWNRTSWVVGLLVILVLSQFRLSAAAEDIPDISPAAEAPQAAAIALPVARGDIAFTSTRHGNAEIYVMKADGSGQTRLTNTPAEEFHPAWSPNGQRIAFASNRDGNDEVYVMKADGSSPTRLTNNPANDYLPDWSPDGQKIAFVSNRDGNFAVLMR
jgi:hypothetical protein